LRDLSKKNRQTMFPLGARQRARIETILKQDLVRAGVHCALLIDLAGNVVARASNGGKAYDADALAALASAHLVATDQLARLIGEPGFSSLFHKGNKENLHFRRVGKSYLLASIFNQDLSLGFVRLKVDHSLKNIESIIFEKEQ